MQITENKKNFHNIILPLKISHGNKTCIFFKLKANIKHNLGLNLEPGTNKKFSNEGPS